METQSLLIRAGGQVCALRLSDIVEVMRPLPVRALAGVPPMVRGLAVIRGAPLAVIALDQVLLPPGHPPATALSPRFVVVRTGERRAALAVDAVLEVRSIDPSLLGSMPPLVQGAAGEAIGALSALDSELLLVLNGGRILPDEVWQSLAGAEE